MNVISDNVHSIRVFDVGNTQNASDIRVDFLVENDKGISEYRIVLIKNDHRDIQINELEDLPVNSYKAFAPGVGKKSVRLDQSQLDSDGDAIVGDQEYVVVIYTQGNKKISNPSVPFFLKDESLLVGEFVGLWNDNLYVDFAISAVLTSSGTTIHGSFYYSGNFTSCCGGTDDGQISFKVNDVSIDNFIYDQDLVNFMGGCPGFYTGTGVLIDEFTISVDFSGEDCEGPHTNGNIRLTKRF